MVDEFPTVNLQGIDVFIGTARKHNVATILAVQDFNQAIRDYGEKSANILRSPLCLCNGNQLNAFSRKVFSRNIFLFLEASFW